VPESHQGSVVGVEMARVGRKVWDNGNAMTPHREIEDYGASARGVSRSFTSVSDIQRRPWLVARVRTMHGANHLVVPPRYGEACHVLLIVPKVVEQALFLTHRL
jgi:hypothetical protein